MNKQITQTKESGIALLITLLIMAVLLGVSASLLNITLKQLQFSSIGLASEMAFQAANAGMECMLNHDYQNYPTSKFDVGQTAPSISCMGSGNIAGTAGTIESGEAQSYEFTWYTPEAGSTRSLCSSVTIYKFFELGTADGNTTGPDMSTALRRTGTCPEDVTCTVIQARGYNVGCSNISTARTIERELTQRY